MGRWVVPVLSVAVALSGGCAMPVRIGLGKRQGRSGNPRKPRKHRCQWLACLLARRDRHQFDLGMDKQQPEQFHTGVTAGSDDGDFDSFHGAAQIS